MSGVTGTCKKSHVRATVNAIAYEASARYGYRAAGVAASAASLRAVRAGAMQSRQSVGREAEKIEKVMQNDAF